MKTVVGREKEKMVWWKNAIAMSLISGLFGALTVAADGNVLSNHIVSENVFVAASVYLVFGGWLGVIATLVYNRVFARRFDKEFTRERWLSWNLQKYALVAGGTSALSTFAYLFILARDSETAIVIALSNLSLVWIALYDRTNRIPVKKLSLAISLTLIGAGLLGIRSFEGTLDFSVWAIAIMFVGNSIPNAVSRVFEKKAVGSFGKTNLAFWRFFWLAVFGTVFAVVVVAVGGKVQMSVDLFRNVWWTALPWILLVMFFAYCNNLFRIIAVADESVSGVAILTSSESAFAVPLTLLAALVFPIGTYAVAALTTEVQTIRFVGASLVAVAVYIIAKEIDERNKRNGG